jgi:LPS-assembly lipoprotein
MSRAMFLRLFCLPLLLLSLSGCGFAPLYGRHDGGGDVPAALNEVAVATIPNRSGQMLRNDLLDRLYQQGTPANPRYDLTIGLEQTNADLGVRLDATSSRTQINLTARYSLNQRDTGAMIISGVAKTSVSYNKLEAQYATLTARENAETRALHEVSEQIINRLALHFKTAPATPATTAISTTP